MVRVGQVVTRFVAGAGGVALRGALALPRDRFHVTIFAAPGGALLGEAERAGWEVVRLPHMQSRIHPWQDWQCLQELTQQFSERRLDIVHTHSSKAGALGRAAARRAGVSGVVHTFHGFPFHDFQPRAVRAAYIAIERRLAALTDWFLAVGGAVAGQAVELRIAPPDRITTIASAIEATIPRATPEKRRRARYTLQLPSAAKVVGTVGRIDRQKAPLDLARAFADLDRQDAQFVWIGEGPLRGDLEREIARLGLDGRFRLVGERQDVGQLLPGFDVFALASLYEGLPCALVEAMTCGIPVVATSVNAVPEVVLPGRSGLLAPPAAPRLLARALAYMLDHPAQAARMAKTARELIGDRFSAERLGRDLTETYEVVLAESRQGAAAAVAGRQVVGWL